MRNGRNATNVSFGVILLIVCFGIPAFLPAASHAGNIRFAGIVPGGGVIHKQIVSMREARYRDLVPQGTDFSCGAAAVATLFKYAYGRRDITEQEVIDGLYRVCDPKVAEDKGFSLLDIKKYLKTLGMRGRGYKVSADRLETVRVPAIVLLDLKGYKHFVVFKKADGGKVYLADPVLGNKVMDKHEFISSWNGVLFAIIGKGFDSGTVLRCPEEPLTVQSLKAECATISEADLLDFGFSHMDLF